MRTPFLGVSIIFTHSLLCLGDIWHNNKWRICFPYRHLSSSSSLEPPLTNMSWLLWGRKSSTSKMSQSRGLSRIFLSFTLSLKAKANKKKVGFTMLTIASFPLFVCVRACLSRLRPRLKNYPNVYCRLFLGGSQRHVDPDAPEEGQIDVLLGEVPFVGHHQDVLPGH